ncbi:MAG: hypothetical protein Q8O58_01905 [Gallionella sp.]|nr:hypothetical protein [Gallionella sp.]
MHPDYVEIGVKSFLQKSSATADATNRSSATVITVPIKLRQRSKAWRLVVQPKQDAFSQEADPKLGALISKAHDWLSRLTSGRYDGVQAIATEEKMTSSYVTRVIYVAYLAPDISLRVLKGDHPPDLTAKKLLSLVPLPDRWEEQRRLLGMQN